MKVASWPELIGKEEGQKYVELKHSSHYDRKVHLFLLIPVSSFHLPQQLLSLTELYASGNQIANLRELVYLKALTRLTVLDISGNPLTRPAVEGSVSYRMFTIYHLPSMKALDGQPTVSLYAFCNSNNHL